MKNLKLITIIVGILLIVFSMSVSAGMSSPSGGKSPSTPSAFCKVDSDTWALCNTSDTLGDASNPINNINTDDLTINNTFTLGGTVATGGIDMDGEIITNIGDAGTDFTATGGLTLADVFSIPNNIWIRARNYADSDYINMFKVNVDDEIEAGASLLTGSIEFNEDSGAVSAMDMPVSDTPAQGTEQSYAFKLDGNNIFQVYAEADNAGGIQNSAVKVSKKLALDIDARTIADSGDGNPATLTLEPTGSFVRITCNDADTCDITMSETNAIDGQIVKITNISANVVDFADTAGVSELAGAFAAGQYDTIEMIYSSDRWIEISRSNN